MKIEVTQEDIKNGHRRDAYRCPVALASKRATGFSVRATQVDITIEHDHNHRKFRTPLEVGRFIHEYDQALPVHPITFELPA